MFHRFALVGALGTALLTAGTVHAEVRHPASSPKATASPRQPYQPIGGKNWQQKIERQNKTTERKFYGRLNEQRQRAQDETKRRLEQSVKQAEQRMRQQQQKNREKVREMFRNGK